jgi:hypothetical protein
MKQTEHNNMFSENKDFFPTPTELINKMITGIEFSFVKHILEPSVGSKS